MNLSIAAAAAALALAGPLAHAKQPDPVTVVNPPAAPANVRDVDAAGRRPFQVSVIASTNTPQALFVPTPGTRLVVEFVSMEQFGVTPPVSRVFVSVVPDPAQPGNATFTHFVPVLGTAAAQPMRLYVEPGQALTVNPANGTGASERCCFISVTGYLINP